MFQKNTTGYIAAFTTAACLTLLPAASFSQDTVTPAPAVQTQSASSTMSALKDISIADLRQGTKTKMSDTRQWVKDTKIEQNVEYFMGDLEKATSKLQDTVAPAGHSIKSFVRNKTPAPQLAAVSEKTITVYGIILMLAFGFVVVLMSISGPASRLGGRH